MIEESISTSNDGRAKLDELGEMIRSITECLQSQKRCRRRERRQPEQARGIEQIAGAVAQMDRIT